MVDYFKTAEEDYVHPLPGDRVMVVDAVEHEIYDVRMRIGRAGVVRELSPWCGEHMAVVQLSTGERETFFREELSIRNRQGERMDGKRVDWPPLP
jgi:hypothetical protein